MQIWVRLPRDMAAKAEELQRLDPDFFSRLVLYGLTRRSIYEHLKEKEAFLSAPREAPAPRPL